MIHQRSRWIAVAVCLGFIGFLWPGPVQVQAEQPGLPEWANKIKNATDWLDWGADLRVRDERFPNAIVRTPDVQDPIREWLRIRTRLWANIKPMEDVAIRARIVNESRAISSPDHYTSTNPHDGYDHFDEIIFDNLYLDLTNFLDTPVRVRFFRQDMLAVPGATGPNGSGFGDGFIFMDGTPGDGSRSFYFDALRVTIDLSQWIEDSSLDVLGIMNKRFTRHHLHPIGGDDYRSLTDKDGDNETYGLYFKTRSWVPSSQFDAYYLYSIQEDFKPETWESGFRGGYWNTVGARVAGNLAQNTRYVLEGAVQFGKGGHRITPGQPIETHQAVGTQESITQNFNTTWKPSLTGYHVFLSGDDPDTEGYEAWKALYNRWPKWGELIGYMGPREDGIYYFTNLHILGAKLRFSPIENVTVTGIYQYLYADQNSRENTTIFADGNRRGSNPQLNVTWAPTKYLSTHVQLEYFDPGDYYAIDDASTAGPFVGTKADDSYYFARWEIYFRF